MTPAGRRLRRQILVRIPLLLLVLLALSVALKHGHTVLTAPTGPPSLRLGAGLLDSDTHTLARAIAATYGELDPGPGLEVVPTQGSQDNVEQLVLGTVDLATVQADTPLPPSLRLVGTLYSDAYLFVVPAGSNITSLADLAGHTIITGNPGSAQAGSLDRILQHYGLSGSVRVTGGSNKAADQALLDGKVDALFRVRSIHNADLRQLARSTPLRLLPVDQGRALSAADPTLQPTDVPRGVLHNLPPLPAHDTPTVQVDRLLVAHQRVEGATIRALARVLFEHRHALIRQTPIASGVLPPTRSVANPVPLHEGVEAWLDRAEPSYLEKNADYVSLLRPCCCSGRGPGPAAPTSVAECASGQTTTTMY